MTKHHLVFGLILLIVQCCVAQTKPGKMNPFDYEKAWKEVTDNESKGLPESALKIVNEIYASAKNENNSGQLAKALINRFKFTDVKEENAFIKNLVTLREEAEKSSFPLKPLLHSMLGELYWQYYQNNRYAFAKRSETANTDETDIETWSISKIVQETFAQYKLSLEDAEKSKKELIDIYTPVIHNGNELGRQYRPTLYDFLANRALGFFASQEVDVTKPAYFFTLNKEDYFLPAKDFVKFKIDSKDTLSMKFYAINILQELIRFHLNDKDPASLVDFDLARLKFVLAHSVLPIKDALYFKALEQLEKDVITDTVVGRVTVEKANVLVQTASLYKPLLSDDHKWDLKKAYELCEEAKKRFPDSDGAILCEHVQTSIRNKSLNAVIEENNVPNKPFRSLVHYKNVTDLYYRIIKVTRAEVRAEREKLMKDYDGNRDEKFLKRFIAKTPFKSGSYKLPTDYDYQDHSIEVKLDGIPEGEYMVLFSHHADFATNGNGLTYAFTVVSNISYLNRNALDGSTEFYVLNRESGEPIAGVAATVYTQRYNSNKGIYESIRGNIYISDVNGYFKVPYFTKEERQNFSVTFAKGNDFNSTEPIDREYYYYSASINQFKQDAPDSHTQTFFFLDRAIYRPGQTIYFKGLLVDTDGKSPKIVANRQVSVILYDVNHQEKGRLQLTTNDYGTFNGVFNAPANGLTGQMSIENMDGSGSISFSVEEYKRPKFEVGFNPITAAFRLNDAVKVEGYAWAYSGATIDGAVVKYRVIRSANFPFWYWCRWGSYPASPELEITNGSTVSDAEGKFTVEFNAIPDLSVDKASDPTFNYVVYADVTDINGETHSSSTSGSVGYKSLLVRVSISNINKDQKDLKKDFAIQTLNLAGEFQAAKGQINVFSLKTGDRSFRERLWEQADKKLYSQSEYYSFFPHDLFEDENNKFKWARDKEVFAITFDTGKNKTFNINDIEKWNVGEYVLEIISTDKDGNAVREVCYFTVFAPSSKSIPSPMVSYSQPLKVVAEPGERAVFSMGTSETANKVLYEVERDGVIIAKEWFTLRKEQRLFEILIKEEDRGNLAVHYTFIKNNRLYSENFVITVPFTNKMLDVSFESFRDKLLPGATEQWKIIIKGRTADKIAAEMVATLYDESLDEFRANSFYANFYNSAYSHLQWQSVNGFKRADLLYLKMSGIMEVTNIQMNLPLMR